MKPLEEIRMALWADAPGELDEVGQALERMGAQAARLESLDDLEAVLKAELADVAVVRLSSCCRETLRWLEGRHPHFPATPVLVALDARDKGLYLEALRRGAFDAVVLPLDERELRRIVRQALEGRTADIT